MLDIRYVLVYTAMSILLCTIIVATSPRNIHLVIRTLHMTADSFPARLWSDPGKCVTVRYLASKAFSEDPVVGVESIESIPSTAVLVLDPHQRFT